MDFNVSKRKKQYNTITRYIRRQIKTQKVIRHSFKLDKVLGKGLQGKVIKCFPKLESIKDEALVIKRSNMDEEDYVYINKPFSRKALKEPSYIEIASLYLVNELIIQKICPNFIMNFHSEILNTCKEPKFSSKKYCTIQYNELLNYGTFEEWAKKHHNVNLWRNAIFQILAALYAMKKHYNLIHNDFHGRNVLVHKVTPGGYWIYKMNNINYYVPNLGFVFLISDFGFSWIPGKMYPESYIINTLGKNVPKHQRLTRDLFIFKKTTIEPLVKVAKGLPEHFKTVFLTVLDTLIDNSKRKNISTIGDIIHTLYGSVLHEPFKSCDENPNYCYNKKKYVTGSRIDTFNLDKPIKKTSRLPKELQHFILYVN
jgi:hypothetical protein